MFLLLEYKLYLTPPLLGIMADVEYEDNGFVTFPFYGQNFLICKLNQCSYVRTLKFTDFGYPDLDIGVPAPPPWTLASEVYMYCCATTLCVVSVVYVFFFIFYEEIICFFLSFLRRKEMNLLALHSRC